MSRAWVSLAAPARSSIITGADVSSGSSAGTSLGEAEVHGSVWIWAQPASAGRRGAQPLRRADFARLQVFFLLIFFFEILT